MQLEPFEGLKLINEAAKKRYEDQLFQVWLIHHPEVSFNKFKDENGLDDKENNKIDSYESKEQILENVKSIVNITL